MKGLNAIYERVSSNGQDLASQHTDLASWASQQKPEEVVWFNDKFTGKTLNRPGMEAMMKLVRAGKVKTIVVYRLDRLGRTAPGLTALFDELQKLGVNLISMREGIDLSTPAGRLIANVLASVAAFETEVRGERQRDGIAAAKARGEKWGGRKKGTMLKRTPEIDQTVRKLKSDGKNVAAIARITSLSRPTIYAILGE